MALSGIPIKEEQCIGDSLEIINNAFLALDRKNSVPTGTVILHSDVSPPDGFLLCDGRYVAYDLYPELYKIITSNGNIFPYGENKGPADNRFFKLPNYADLFVPTGGIIMWNGPYDNIPGGWLLCDGNNGTPDLTDKFVMGAGGPIGGAVGESGGSHTITLNVGELPSHTHAIIDPGHRHDFRHKNPPYEQFFVINDLNDQEWVDRGDGSYLGQGPNATNDAHWYPYTNTNMTNLSVGYAGSNAPITITPPYYCVYYITRKSIQTGLISCIKY